ncbi:bifunctional DNA primase/polymerase [Kitasatospora sp. NPDC058032]|uniref:bifunctional DNA primase/polymerase n=1 Tax=Kitasatospora sp. NPDC058032 TaxID=3346307 RepID=UPI0036D97051
MTLPPLLQLALWLAARGIPVLPLGANKRPLRNCRVCADIACGGRSNMKVPGPCRCPLPCHAWAAATLDPAILTSPAWARAWRQAAAVGYHPGGAGVTVVDLDSADAVAWARAALPPTITVSTTRGQHWIYRGVMNSANHVRLNVDIKSRMHYARWLGAGAGIMTDLPDAVRALAAKEDTTPAPFAGRVASSTPASRWSRSAGHGCRHTEGYVRTGLSRGVDLIRARQESGAGSQAFGAARFLAAQHTCCPGPCHLDTLAQDLVDAAVSVGVPRPYATRAVSRGLAAAGSHLT